MSQEITHTMTLTLRKGAINLSQTSTKQADQATPGGLQRQVAVPTSDTVVAYTGITTPRYFEITNLDTVNYIDVGVENSGAIVGLFRLLPGESCGGPLKPSSVLRWQAHTAPCNALIMLLET